MCVNIYIYIYIFICFYNDDIMCSGICEHTCVRIT